MRAWLLALLVGCGSAAQASSSPEDAYRKMASAVAALDWGGFYDAIDPGSRERELVAACRDAAWYVVSGGLQTGGDIATELHAIDTILARHRIDPAIARRALAAEPHESLARRHKRASEAIAAAWAKAARDRRAFYADLMTARRRGLRPTSDPPSVTGVVTNGNRATVTLSNDSKVEAVAIDGQWYIDTRTAIHDELDARGAP